MASLNAELVIIMSMNEGIIRINIYDALCMFVAIKQGCFYHILLT